MSLKLAAEHLKAQGRGKDTELVHMDKGEIEALKGIAHAHGGQLTTNPETGLTEAGFLSSILPMVAGAAAIALAPETGGASLALEPWMVGAGVGALDYAITGNLKQGLMAGLGAYGGAGLASGLAGLGATAAAEGIPASTTQDVLASASSETGGLTPYQQALGSSTSTTADNAAEYFNKVGSPENMVTGNVPPPPTTPSTISNIGSGLQAAANAPGAFLSNNLGYAASAAAPALMGGNAFATPTNPQLAQSQQKNPMGLKSISPNFQGQYPAQPNPPYQAQYPDYRQAPYNSIPGVSAASGGIMVDRYDEGGASNLTKFANAVTNYHNITSSNSAPEIDSSLVGSKIYTDTDPNTAPLDAYGAAMYRLNKANKKAGIKQASALPAAKSLSDIEEAASGGIMGGAYAHGGEIYSLGGYSDGGRLLRGPGDGMSDNIPAVIGKKQPARLADGEFVVPADVVSHLGNGSTEAGAKHLYAMMDKIRKARTGKKKQAPQVKAEKYLPK